MGIEQADMAVLRRVLSVPTAPFHEQVIADDVASWATEQGLASRRDRWGNVVLDWPGDPLHGAGAWCLAAHLDHPGFVLRRAEGSVAWAEFLGGVREEFFVGGRVAFFDGERVTRGVIRNMTMPPSQGEGFPLAEIELSEAVALSVGAVGMWDFPAMRVRGETLSSRACDDLVGCAAVLCAMRRIVEARWPHRVLALLTRAEEVGFVGALAACEAGTVPPGALVISIETSKAQSAAPLGGGAVVRVGDAACTFDPAVTAMLSATAAALAKEDESLQPPRSALQPPRSGFRWSRQLMPGGVCEATAFQTRGFRVGGVCLPLANYHNMGPNGKIAPERVNLRDFDAVVRLLTALAKQPPDPSAVQERLTHRLDDILTRHRQRL